MTYRITANTAAYMTCAPKIKNLAPGENKYKPKKFGQKPLKENWLKAAARFLKGDSGSTTIADISGWSGNALVFNQKAFDVCAEHLEQLGEFLAIDAEGIPYYLFNTLYHVPDSMVDVSQSELAESEGIALGAKKLAFVEERIDRTNPMLFKTHYDFGAGTFCTEKFKTLIEEHQLTGLLFGTDLAPLYD